MQLQGYWQEYLLLAWRTREEAQIRIITLGEDKAQDEYSQGGMYCVPCVLVILFIALFLILSLI